MCVGIHGLISLLPIEPLLYKADNASWMKSAWIEIKCLLFPLFCIIAVAWLRACKLKYLGLKDDRAALTYPIPDWG